MKVFMVIIWITSLGFNQDGTYELGKPVGMTQVEYASMQACVNDLPNVKHYPNVDNAQCVQFNTGK